ncbi:MAG: hypothetical protein HQK77_13910, partial [Desulfobacterales bacterium]|nr:hypothetical protein [Desulfobacterales bacterium]
YGICSVIQDRVIVVDILFPPSRNLIEAFFSHISCHYKSMNLKKIEIYLPSMHFISSILQSIGFQLYSNTLGFIPTIRRFPHSPVFSWIDRHFYQTMADADLF